MVNIKYWLMLGAIIFVTGCNSTTPLTQENLTIQVYTKSGVTSLYSGESISLVIKMENIGQDAIEISNFFTNGKAFAYNTSTAISLLSPSGINLFENFFTNTFPEEFEPIIISPNSDYIFIIQPSMFLVLDEIGSYTFSVKFQDKTGFFYKSTETTFDIIPIPTQCPIEMININLDVQPKQFKYSERLDLKLFITIENHSNNPFVFYDIIYSSYFINPIYHFKLQDKNGLIFMPRIAQDPPTTLVYPDYEALQIEIPPHSHYKIEGAGRYIPTYSGLANKPGIYTLQFTYITLPRDPRTQIELKLAPNTCLGVIQSEPVQLEILPEE